MTVLKLLALFKMTDDLDEVTLEEWNHCLDGGEPSFLKQIIGTYDEAALELVLRLKEDAAALGQEVQAVALTVGADLPDLVMKNLFGVQYDRVVHLAYDGDLRFRPELTAEMIASFAKWDGGFDLAAAGQQANVGNNGMTHLLLADRLNLPCVLNVTDAALEENRVLITSLYDGGSLTQSGVAPVVLGVENVRHPYLRVATLRERMAAGKKRPERLDGARFLDREPPVRAEYLGLRRDVKTRDCRIIEGATPREKAQVLCGAYLREVLEG